MSEVEHAKLAPSSAARRVACPGSRALEARYPEDQESPSAREGTAAHEIASWALKPYNATDDVMPPGYPYTSNGELITTEMLQGADLYAECIYAVCGKNRVSELIIEERIDISVIHPDCWGTPDCWLYTGSEIHVWDYKYGHGFVDVFENWQMIEYAAGIIHKLKINGIKDRQTYVTFYVVQPRCYNREGPIRTWRVLASDLRPYFNILEASERAAAKDDVACHPSPECTYCLGRHACEALQKSALAVVDMTASNTPFELPPMSLGNELRYLKRAAELLDSRITGLEEQALAALRRGERVPFYKLEQSMGREQWKVPPHEIITLGEMLGYDLKKPTEAITPRQAVKAGLSEELIAGYAERPAGAMKLVSDDGSKARKVFGGINEKI